MTITLTSCVWKLDHSQWKADTNHPILVEGSIGMYHWEILCLEIVKTATTKKLVSNHYKFTLDNFTYIYSVWKLGVSQWKVNIDNPKLVEGSLGISYWEI